MSTRKPWKAPSEGYYRATEPSKTVVRNLPPPPKGRAGVSPPPRSRSEAESPRA
jgi:hypothetical protein